MVDIPSIGCICVLLFAILEQVFLLHTTGGYMKIERVKYDDGVVFTRLLNSFGVVIAEVRGKRTMKQMMKYLGENV